MVDLAVSVRGSHCSRELPDAPLRSRTAAATSAGSMLPVVGSTSTKIGTARSYSAQFAEATKEKRGRNDQIPVFDARGDHGQVEACRTTGHRTGVPRTNIGPEVALELVDPGSDAEMRCREYLADGRRFAERQVGRRHGDFCHGLPSIDRLILQDSCWHTGNGYAAWNIAVHERPRPHDAPVPHSPRWHHESAYADQRSGTNRHVTA